MIRSPLTSLKKLKNYVELATEKVLGRIHSSESGNLIVSG